MTTAIELKDVSFSYGREKVLDQVNLEIEEKDFSCVIGPNGGGKTTFLKLILGLLKPDSGKVLVFGKSPEKMSPKMGYMPQYIELDPKFPITVMEIVLMGRLGFSRSCFFSSEDKEIARNALEEVEMTDQKKDLFFSLSGGQRQRVLIARALASEPSLLLLDEPTSNVDAESEFRFMELLKTLNQRMTIMMVSHDLGMVSSYVKSVVCVNKQVLEHSTEEISGHSIQDFYGNEMRLVRHEGRCVNKECSDE